MEEGPDSATIDIQADKKSQKKWWIFRPAKKSQKKWWTFEPAKKSQKKWWTFEPDKKSQKKWWIIVGVLIFLFLCLAASSVVGSALYFGYSTISAPVKPIELQLEALNQGDYRKAYTFCSKRFKEKVSYDDFVHIVKSNPQVFKSRTSSFGQVSFKNRAATVSGTITGKDGTVTPMFYQLVKEEGKWRIQFFKEGSQDETKDSKDDSSAK